MQQVKGKEVNMKRILLLLPLPILSHASNDLQRDEGKKSEIKSMERMWKGRA